jgi:hypothetical protein
MINYEDNNKNVDHTLYDVDKGKGGGIIGNGERKRVLKSMDASFLRKIELLKNTMKVKSDGFNMLQVTQVAMVSQFNRGMLLVFQVVIVSKTGFKLLGAGPSTVIVSP